MYPTKQKRRNPLKNEGITPNNLKLNMLWNCAKKEWCRGRESNPYSREATGF